MSRLDLVEASMLTLGKKCLRRGDKLTGQCPAHEDRNPSFVASYGRDGESVIFHCSSGCSGVDIMDALGLRWDQIKADDYRQQAYRRRPKDPTFEECFVMVAENDLRQGKKLPPSDMERYQLALLKLYGQTA